MVELQQILSEIRDLRQELRLSQRGLLPIEAAAAYLGIAPKTIRNSLGRKAQKPFPVRPVRYEGKVLFKLADLQKLRDSLPEYTPRERSRKGAE